MGIIVSTFMLNLVEMGCYTGMRLRVSMTGEISWQPNKLAGSHGARYVVNDKDGLSDMVLAKRPRGSWVKICRGGGVLCSEENKPLQIGEISSEPLLELPKFDVNPADISPGMIWAGPFDGEYHHFCEDRFWVNNSDNRRCHYSPPSDLKAALELFKPTGGSFLVNPWGHVIVLIRPQPLPEEAEERWNKMSKEERRLLQIKQKGTGMLPIYACKWDSDWEVELQNPLDFSKPLNKEEISEMKNFLSQYSQSKSMEVPPIEEGKDAEVEEDFTEDDDEFFDDYGDIHYSPSDN